MGRTARAGKSGVAISMVTQYDIEVFQRIERALGKKLDEHEAVREEVMVFTDKVSEAQRVAIRELKDHQEKRAGKGKGGTFGKGKRRVDMDREER